MSVKKIDNEPLSNVDRYGEVDGPLPFLPNANFMPHWFIQWGLFFLRDVDLNFIKRTRAQTLIFHH